MGQTIIDKNLIDEVLTRAVDKIYPSREALERELLSGRRLRIYLGVDPTGPHLHLGHLTNLLTLKRFQDLGHEIIFLIGDFTARIGDPTDKLSPRQPLTQDEVKENLKTFKKQAGRILKFAGENRVQIKFNSKWLAKMTTADWLGIFQKFTVQQMIQRDMFQDRMRENKPVGLHEFLYPLMQGYDSVAMDVDMEIGGTDQTFNMLAGRDLMKIYKNKEKFVLTTKLLENPKTGMKLMSKSEGGLINLDDEPNDIFGKVMARDDETVVPIAEFSTDLPIGEVRAIRDLAAKNPREAKLKTAFAVVETIYSKAAAARARREFIKVFSEKQKPDEIETITLHEQNISLTELLVKAGLASSKSDARRLIEQGGVKINDERQTNPEEIINLTEETLIQVGPRRFLKVKGS